MKKLILVAILLLIATQVRAEAVDLNVSKLDLPDVKVGAVYLPNADDSTIETATMATILKYDMPEVGKIDLPVLNLDAIYSPDNRAGGGVSLEIGSLDKITGVELALAKYIDFTIGAGCLYDFNSEKAEFAVYGTACRIQF